MLSEVTVLTPVLLTMLLVFNVAVISRLLILVLGVKEASLEE